MKEATNVAYIFGDGDRVRERLDGFLFNHELNALSQLSKRLEQAVRTLAQRLQATMAAETIVAGGDDLIVRIPIDRYRRDELEGLAMMYQEQTGATISFGVAPTIEGAYLNLRRAKSSSTAKIVESGMTS
jgi:hypothetical protein